jgi:hypothetical protein
MVVTMEKLYPLKRNSKLYDIVIDNFQLQGIDISNTNSLGSYFSLRSNRVLLARNTKNPKLREALRLVEHIIKMPFVFPDMHNGNWMIRLTGVGPQLVIVDPVIGALP